MLVCFIICPFAGRVVCLLYFCRFIYGVCSPALPPDPQCDLGLISQCECEHVRLFPLPFRHRRSAMKNHLIFDELGIHLNLLLRIVISLSTSVSLSVHLSVRLFRQSAGLYLSLFVRFSVA